jgi:hypothetical protein
MSPTTNSLITLLSLLMGALSLLPTYGVPPLATASLGSFVLGIAVGAIATRHDGEP